MSEEERQRLMKLGDQVFERWQELEQSGKTSLQIYSNIPKAATLEDLNPREMNNAELTIILQMLESLNPQVMTQQELDDTQEMLQSRFFDDLSEYEDEEDD